MAEDEVVKAISTLMEALTPLDKEAREHALDFVMKRLGISLGAAPAPMQHPGLPTPPTPITPATPPIPDQPGQDIRSFAALKSPNTMNEKVAVMAYYLAQLAPPAERRDYITPEDIKPYFIQADFELPTATGSMTLTNAKNAGYLNALERGQYRLNSVGHNLVAHKLPNKDAGAKSTRRSVKKAVKKGKR
ncbi:hypothetical protein [Bradyrhizobium monzae]|uniref:hypothetical protein n=1 Tax=Bradyrhizobium sp. Oc8 TaxID=2876780 RepID=UPI001F413A39|nr:hypothetical protein [Bradyrhizobium sp. Oc8]